jgi:hypothetical protein
MQNGKLLLQPLKLDLITTWSSFAFVIEAKHAALRIGAYPALCKQLRTRSAGAGPA